MFSGNASGIAFRTVVLCLVGSAYAAVAQQGDSSEPAHAGANGSTAGTTASTPATATPTPAAEASNTYRIGPGDVLHISVWREDTLNQSAVVRTDGKISLPLIAEVSVAGKTPMAVQQMLTESYSAFITRPAVTVTVTEVNSQIVYILGEVQKPGAYPFVQSLGLLQLIARAGGLTPYAKKHSIYLLQGADHRRVAVNFDKLVKGEGTGVNLALVSGDTVVVP